MMLSERRGIPWGEASSTVTGVLSLCQSKKKKEGKKVNKGQPLSNWRRWVAEYCEGTGLNFQIKVIVHFPRKSAPRSLAISKQLRVTPASLAISLRGLTSLLMVSLPRAFIAIPGSVLL